MAAAYLFHLVRDHPFIDGNKRVGLAVLLTFLGLNFHWLDADADELEQLLRSVAAGRSLCSFSATCSYGEGSPALPPDYNQSPSK